METALTDTNVAENLKQRAACGCSNPSSLETFLERSWCELSRSLTWTLILSAAEQGQIFEAAPTFLVNSVMG